MPEEYRLSPEQSAKLLKAEILGRFKIWQLPEQAAEAFLRAAVAERAAGGRIYDAHIAAIARVAGARLVITENVRHFTALGQHGIRVARAAELAAE